MNKLEINYTVGIYQDYKEGKFASQTKLGEWS